MNLVDPDIENYLHGLVPRPDDVRQRMERLGAEKRFPIIGPLVGNLCAILARSIGAQRVYELGSGFGYSTLWFARAVGPRGSVVHTDGSEDNSRQAREFLESAGVAARVRFEVGNALEILRGDLDGPGFDPVDVLFSDIDKHQYPQVLPLARRVLRPGGLLIVDNMLWKGRVLDHDSAEPDTRGVLELTRLLREAADFTTMLVPIRDGVTVSLKAEAG